MRVETGLLNCTPPKVEAAICEEGEKTRQLAELFAGLLPDSDLHTTPSAAIMLREDDLRCTAPPILRLDLNSEENMSPIATYPMPSSPLAAA